MGAGFNDVVLPLTAVLVRFPAKTASGTKIFVVRIACIFGSLTDFSAGSDFKGTEIAVVVEPVCCKANKVSDTAFAAKVDHASV